MCSWFDVSMVAERRSTVLGSLSGKSVEHVVQRAKSSEKWGCDNDRGHG